MHTPGPWHLHPSGKANLLGDYTVFFGSGESAGNQICQAEHANAVLIAAAPDLFAACQAVLDAWESGDLAAAARQCASAIAKATA